MRLSLPGNNLPQARGYFGAVSSSSYGYFGGGSTPSYVATVDRIDFSNETTSAPGNNLSQARNQLAATQVVLMVTLVVVCSIFCCHSRPY